jgi:Family of unknown function (DUF6263)
MMIRRTMCLSVACFLASSLPLQAEVKLEWKFKEGDKFQTESITTLVQTMTVGGQTNRQDFETILHTSFTVKKTEPDGSVELRMQIEKIKASNRANPASPAASTQVRALEDVVLTIFLNPKREVTKLEGFEDVLKRVTNDDATSAKAIREIVKEENLRRQAEEAFGFLPDRPVNKGDKWERKIEAALGPLGTILATHTYTYEGPEMKQDKSLHKISVASNFTYVPPKAATPGFQFQITKGEVKTENATGTIWFDADAGRLVSSETKMKIKGTLTIGITGQSQPQEFVIDQEQTGAIRVTPK